MTMKKTCMKLTGILLAGILCLDSLLPVRAEPSPEPSPQTETQEVSQTPVPQESASPLPEETDLPEEPPAAEEVTENTPSPEETPEPEDTETAPAPEPQSEQTEAEPAVWTDRLIVIGADVIREKDHVIAVYEDLALLGFANGDALQEGYAYYSVHARHAEPDGVVLAAEEGGDLKDAPNEISEENNPMDQLQQLLAEAPAEAPSHSPLIALIDTGVKPDCRNLAEAVSVLGEDPSDDNGHGSWMAELILAEDPSARILSIKALDANGHGTISSVFAAMEYAQKQNADIIALCVSACVSSENKILQEKIDEAAAQGITVVGAAGNSGLNVKYFVPGNTASALIAGSCDSGGTLRSFSNRGDTVDYLVVSESTSEAAARLCGMVSRCGKNTDALADDPRVFRYGTLPEIPEPSPSEDPKIDDDFYSQCNGFFYGDAYFWEIPAGNETTADAQLIDGYQQEILEAKTDTANGYDVLLQKISEGKFTPGHGYAVFASTHKEKAVTKEVKNVHVTDFLGKYEAWGKKFNSSRTFEIAAKEIPDYEYLGVIVSQNKTAVPEETAVSGLSQSDTASVKLGEEGATYWTDVPGVDTQYWKGWANTKAGKKYSSFRVDFYYQSVKPKHNLTIHYLEEGTEEPVADTYGPKQMPEESVYRVPSPEVTGYELVNPEEKIVTGTMPDHDVELTVYYRRVYTITTKVINGTITLNNEMEKDGTTGDETWNAEGAVTGIREGEDRTIRYEKKPDYVLDYVKIDGQDKDIGQYPDAYTFHAVQDDHTVEVRYVPSPVPDDAKQVKNAQGVSIDGQMVSAGDVLTYTVKVINVFSGPREFEIRDRIPERTAYVPDSADHEGVFEHGTLHWKFTLEEGKETTVSFRVIVLPEAKGTAVRNTANVFVGGMELTTNETENPVLPDPVKRVENAEGEDCDGQTVPVDQNVRYFITVKNPGRKEQLFTIIDEVDERQTADPGSISDQGSLKGRTITWKVTVPAEREYTVSFAAMPKDLELTIPNQAEVQVNSVKALTNETVIYTPGKAVKTVTTTGGIDLNGKAIALNEEFVYRIAVTNPSAKKKEYQVTDTLPEEVQAIEAGTCDSTYEAGGANASVSGQQVTWKKELAGGETMTLYILCRLKTAGTVFTNRALVISDNIETLTNEVKNWSGQIIINAEIEEYWEPYGQPSFLYDIKDGNGTEWHRMIIIDPKTKTGQAVFDIPTGHDADTWRISDEKGSRYIFRSASAETENVSVSGNISTAVIAPERPLGITRYRYGIERWDETSHLDAVINELRYRRS